MQPDHGFDRRHVKAMANMSDEELSELGGVLMAESATRFTVGKDIFPGPNDRGCDACRKPLESGQRVYNLCHNATPWRSMDDEPDWSGYTWHVDCDEGSVAAACST